MVVEVAVPPPPPPPPPPAGAGSDGDQRRDLGARLVEKALLAVKAPRAAAPGFPAPRRPAAREPSRGAGAGCVAAGVGFGQAEPAERPAGAQVGQPFLALRLGAEPVDRVGAEPDAGLERDGERLVDPGQLLDGDAQRGEVGAAAAVLLGERDAEQAEPAHLAHYVEREGVVGVPALGVRRDLGLGEVTHQLAQGLLLVAELNVHIVSVLTSPYPPAVAHPPLAVVGGRLLTRLVDVTDDIAALDGRGMWAVVIPFDGPPVCARFAEVRPARPWPGAPWRGPHPEAWTTSLDRAGFCAGVDAIRAAIAAGDVYQVNLTRRLSAPASRDAHVAPPGAALRRGDPAPYAAVIRIPSVSCHVASASPERFLRREA